MNKVTKNYSRYFIKLIWFVMSIIMLSVATLFFVGNSEKCYGTPKEIIEKISSLNDLPVIGDLGGTRVSIPKDYANFVEYDRNLSILEKYLRDIFPCIKPAKISSFGLAIDLQSMKPVSIFESGNIYTSTRLRVGILSNSRYIDHLILDRAVYANLHYGRMVWGRTHYYKRQDAPVFGLTEYTFDGIDNSMRTSDHFDTSDENLYVHKNEAGMVDTFITCSNVRHRAAPCQQHFLLEPNIHAEVRVDYRIGLLSDWRNIKEKVGSTIVGFRQKAPDQLN